MKTIMGMAMIACSLALGAKALAMASIPDEQDWVEPIYRVSVESGSVQLSGASVTRTEAGSTTELTGVPSTAASGTIVKTGSGELTFDESLASFKGQIHVKEGVAIAVANASLGIASSTTYVHQAATLVVDNSQGGISAPLANTVFFAGGEGASGWHGQYVMIKGSNSNGNRHPLVSKTVLGADTTWNLRSTMVWEGRKTIDLQGYELTLNNKNAEAGSMLCIDKIVVSNPGGIVVDGMNCFQIREILNNTFSGAGYISFINNAKFDFSESQRTRFPMEWKLILSDYTTNYTSRAVTNYTARGIVPSPASVIPNTSYVAFGGLELRQGDMILSNTKTATASGMTDDDYAPLAIMGPFSGNYGITYRGEDAQCRHWLVTLASAENTFTGGVRLYEDSRLDLLGGGNVLPAEGGNLVMATGAVLGFGEGNYTLPGAEFDGDATLLDTMSGTKATGRWTKPVVKTGSGTMEYDVTIGGPVLDVRGGTVRLTPDYAAVAGLNKGMMWFADNGYTSDEAANKYYYGNAAPKMDSSDYNKKGYHNDLLDTWIASGYSWNDANFRYSDCFAGSECWTNAVVSSLDIAYASTDLGKHPRYCVFTYTGYVWNDSAEDVTWTVASAFNDHQIWKLNGQIAYEKSTTPTAANNPARSLFPLTLRPGPNAIEIRTYNQYITPPNFYSCATNGFRNAILDFGVGYAKAVTESDDVGDYSRFEDLGDGAVFTREVAPSYPLFEKLCMTAGSVLDLNNAARGEFAPYVFSEIEGSGVVTNGNVVVDKSLTVRKADLKADHGLAVFGKLKFNEGAVIKVADNLSLPSQTDGFVIARAERGIEGLPSIDEDYPFASGCNLVIDGNSLKLKVSHGFAIIFR